MNTPTTGDDAPGRRPAPDPDDLIARHLDLARALARRCRGPRLDDEELEAEANLALVEAAHAYDLAAHPDTPFRAFAGRLIRGRLREALERSGIVRMPRALERRAMADEGHAATPRPHDVAVERLGMMAEEPDPERRERAALVEEVLSGLDDEAEAVIRLVALDDLTVHEAARRLGVHWTRALTAHDRACRTIAGEFRRRGWDERSWAQAIA